MATMTVPRGGRIKTRLPDEFRTGNGHGGGDPLATFLGVFSIGLGLAETLAPRRFAHLSGVRYSPAVVQAYGARELPPASASWPSGSRPGGCGAGSPATSWTWPRSAPTCPTPPRTAAGGS